MFRPKKIKYIKHQRGRLKNIEHKTVAYFPCSSLGYNFTSTVTCYLTSLHLDVAVKLIKKKLARKGILRMRIFPDKPFTSKSIGSRMGKGKGAISSWKAKVTPGITLFSVSGVPAPLIHEAFNLVVCKIPCQLALISRKSSAKSR